MKIKIDMKLLEEQIHMCVTRAMATCSDQYEQDIFEGIANLLRKINYALENDEEIEFEKVEEE